MNPSSAFSCLHKDCVIIASANCLGYDCMAVFSQCLNNGSLPCLLGKCAMWVSLLLVRFVDISHAIRPHNLRFLVVLLGNCEGYPHDVVYLFVGFLGHISLPWRWCFLCDWGRISIWFSTTGPRLL
jgi:hypothetical protein